MLTRLTWLFALLICCVGAPVWAQPAAAPADATLEVELSEALDAWEEHRQQAIVVLDIEGLSGAGLDEEGKAELEHRLKTLLNKKRSNREWKDYWAKEKELAEQVLASFVKIKGASAEEGAKAVGLTQAKAALSASQAAIAAKTTDARQQEADVAAARPTLQASVEALKNSAAVAEREAATRGASLKRLEAATERARKRVEKLAGDADEAARAAAQAKLAEALKAETAGREELVAATSDAQKARAGVLHIQDVLAGRTPTTEAPGAPAAEALATFTQATQRLTTLRGELKAIEVRAEIERKAVSDAEARLSQIDNRRPLLEAWIKLGADKVANQDRYYAAITQDIAAVEERLLGFAETQSIERAGAADAVCDGSSGEFSSAYARHHACIKATRAARAELESATRQIEATLRLTRIQTQSSEQLLAAQRADEKLAARERSLSSSEAQRATLDPSEESRWRQMWSEYAERTRTKEATLHAAARTTKSTLRVLKVNAAFYTTELSAAQARIDTLNQQLAKRSAFGKVAKALVISVWDYLKLGYMIPIFLLVAWLLIRVVRRVSKGLVARARAAHAENEDEVDHDGVQRVETLTVVVGGAVRLVIYVATFLLILDALTVDIGPILGGAAIFGLAISFGSQSLVKDVVTGFFILLENQYAVGDVIQVSGLSGTVEKVTLRRTVLRAMDGQVHSVPNGSISSVSNMTQGWSRVVSHLGVGYESDLDLVQRTVDEVGAAMYADPEWTEKLEEPPTYIGVTKFGDDAITVRVMFKTDTFQNWGAERRFNYLIKKAFEENGISIPYPQRTVHLVRNDTTDQ